MSIVSLKESGEIVRDVLPKLALLSATFLETLDLWIKIIVGLIVGAWTIQQWLWRREDRLARRKALRSDEA